MLPFPDDYYTVNDDEHRAGRRIDFETERDAGERCRRPHGRGALRANDGFSPGQSIVVRVPGLDTPEALAGDQPGRPPRARPVHEEGRARRRHRRDDRRALADLGRDRLERHLARRDGGADPPGQELHRRPSLHRRDAQPQGRRRRDARRSRGLPLLPRRPALEQGADQRPARPLRQHLQEAARTPTSSAATSTWPGTSPSPATRTSPRTSWRCATTPSASSATPTSPTDGRGQCAGRSPSLGGELPADRRRAAAAGRGHGAPGAGHVRGPLLHDRPRRARRPAALLARLRG